MKILYMLYFDSREQNTMTYIKKYSSMQISQSNYTIMKIIMIPISDFQEVIFLDLETLPKLVFTILVPL